MKRKVEYKPQPNCPHCGGLHFGQRFDDCPYHPKIAAGLKAAGGAPDTELVPEEGQMRWRIKDEAKLVPKDEGEKIMQPHQQRVVDEKAELSDKLDKLETFHDGSIYAGLPPAEQSRLTRQLYIMKLYEQVLSERISAF